MKKYNAFASEDVRRDYICKSEITRELLNELNIPKDITIDYAKKIFNDCIYKENVVWVYRGSSKDKKKRRLTPFVKRRTFYYELIKGLPR